MTTVVTTVVKHSGSTHGEEFRFLCFFFDGEEGRTSSSFCCVSNQRGVLVLILCLRAEFYFFICLLRPIYHDGIMLALIPTVLSCLLSLRIPRTRFENSPTTFLRAFLATTGDGALHETVTMEVRRASRWVTQTVGRRY
jgi:hypothetical protein